MKNSLLVFVFFFLAGVSLFGQDRFTILEEKLNQAHAANPGLTDKIDMEVNTMTIQDFIAAMGKLHNMNVTADANIDVKINAPFKNITVQEIFMFLARKYDLDISFIGPIMSFTKYSGPVLVKENKPLAKKINVSYDSTNNLLSFDLTNDSLSSVAKAITRASGKNMAFSPDLINKTVNGFIQFAPFDNALEKLAFSNDLKINKTQDGFYLIEKAVKEPGKNTNPDGLQNGNLVNSGQSKSNNQNFKIEGGLITLDVKNSPISDIISAISAQLGYNYFLLNELKGNTTANIKDATYEDFLKYIFHGTDYTYKKDGDNYLFGDRNLEGLRVSKLIHLMNRTSEKILDFIPADLKKGVDLKVFEDLNSIIVSGSQPRTIELESFIRQLDQVVPNVYLEVIIVDVRNSATFAAGLSAGLGKAPANTTGTVIPFNYTLGAGAINNVLSALNGISSLNLGNVGPNFYIALNASETKGYSKTRSTPQMATLNGHKAEMSIGQQEYYLEVANNLVQTTGVQQNILQSQQYKSVTADLSLSILPQISGDGQITMDIHIKQSTFTTRISPTAPPGTINRDFKAMLRIKDGEMVMLGGLEEQGKDETGSGLPFISRVPVLKWFFGTRTRAKKDNKLTIFIRPTKVTG
ncbi:MAG: type II secretion system protein GspD [Bacteroidia bacterium]